MLGLATSRLMCGVVQVMYVAEHPVSTTAGKFLESRLGGEGTNARASESSGLNTVFRFNSIVFTDFTCLPLVVPLNHSFLVFGCQMVAQPPNWLSPVDSSTCPVPRDLQVALVCLVFDMKP
jgi:hypothetical protein